MMEELKALVERHRVKTRPAEADSILALETKLGFKLSPEYRYFLSTFGVIVFGSAETYGLGVPENYYLNVWNSYTDLSRDPTYPKNAVPVLDVGDGQYYLYDNKAQKLVLWATPNGGCVKVLEDSLEAALSKLIFK